jgi:rubrerythrin
MILERRDWLLWTVSSVVWRIPGRVPAKLAGFSHTEAGSAFDMLAAVEETPRREMRVKYFRHALDEMKHATMFRKRAIALSSKRTGRTQAMLDDSSFIREHGINEADSLFSKLGEIEFLAFVWIAERRGAQQFDVYADLLKDDDDTQAMFAEIAKDERFHISYSRAELDRYETDGELEAVKEAVSRVKRRRWLEAWLRFSIVMGDFMSNLWLGILYILVLGPSSIFARISERQPRGFVTPEPPQDTLLECAQMQA